MEIEDVSWLVDTVADVTVVVILGTLHWSDSG